MIIVGYYGIGKSFAAKEDINLIDLESKYYRDRDSEDGWLGGEKGLKSYIWLATDLSKSGKVVLISANEDIRKELLDRVERGEIRKAEVRYICPRPEDKDEWLSLLYKRWQDSTDRKDYYAYKRASKNYEYDIDSMKKDNLPIAWIKRSDVEGSGLYSFIMDNFGDVIGRFMRRRYERV